MASASVPPSSAEVLHAERQQDPDSWLRAAAWLVITLSALQILLFSFGRDQGIYAMVASGILDGQMPYRDVWDFKPPGIFLIYAGSFALFGESMMAPRIVEVLFLFGTALGCQRLGGVLFQSRTLGLVAGALAAFLHAQLEFWHSGQPETFAGALTIFALVLTTHSFSRHRELWAWLGVGALFGCAFLLKPPLGGGALACGLYLAAQRRQDGRSLFQSALPVLWMAAGSLVPIVLTLVWFWSQGALADLKWTLLEFAPGYTKLGWVNQSAPRVVYRALEEAFFNYSALISVGTLAALAIHPRRSFEARGAVLLLGTLAFQLLGVALQAKFFQYHFAASVPLLSLLSALGFYKLWRRIGPGSIAGTLAFALLLATLPLLRSPVNDVPLGLMERSRLRLLHLASAGRLIGREELDRRLYYVASYRLSSAQKVAAYLERTLPDGAPIYLWGFEPAVYWLSHHPASSRYIYNVPQRAAWQAERARAILLRELKQKPPAAIILQRRDGPKMVLGHTRDSVDSLHQFPALERLIQRDFERGPEIDQFVVYHRKSGPSPAAAP